jgi:uncharacterized protein (TIGR00290 family)
MSLLVGCPLANDVPGRFGSGRLGSALVLSWSGGKDSALALQVLRVESGTPPVALLTTVTECYEAVSMHGVRRALLHRQAEATGLPLVEVEIPPMCSDEVYEARLATALASTRLRGAETVAFGDVFLDDIRAYRERSLAAVGKRGCFPLWGRETGELARRFLAEGFRAVVVCVNPRTLDASFAGRDYDDELLRDLPATVDPCGENGEFHTFVYDGPVFASPIGFRRGVVVERDGFVFCDILAVDA